MSVNYFLLEQGFSIDHYRISHLFSRSWKGRIACRYLFVILTLLFFCDIAAHAGLSSEQPKNSDIEVTLSGALARRNLAELLILLGQCRFNEQKDCPDPLTLNSFPPPIDKSLSEVELYAAAQRRGIWPASGVGFESAFSAYYRSKVNQYGEEAFPAATVDFRTVRSRTPVFVSDREKWPTSTASLSPQTMFKLCKTFLSEPVPDCIVQIEPVTREPILRVEKGISGKTQFVWKDLPGFIIKLHLAVDISEAASIAEWLTKELTQRVKARGNQLPYEEDILTRLVIVAPNVQQSASVRKTPMTDVCSLRAKVGWPVTFSPPQREGLDFPSLLIADLNPMERSDNNQYIDVKTRTMQLEQAVPEPCGNFQKAPPLQGLRHSIAVAAVISRLLINKHELHFIETEEASNAGPILSLLEDTRVRRRPFTIVPGKKAPNNDLLPTDNNKLLFSMEYYRAELNRLAGANGTLLAIAVPQKDAVPSEVLNSMAAPNNNFQFRDLRDDDQVDYPRLPRHELQKQFKAGSCAAWPICLATTPFAIGVGPLDAKGKLLKPNDYLLGAGWTWIAAPASEVPIAIKAKMQDSEHAGKPLQVAGFYEGTSFATPIIGALLENIMDMTPSDTQVSVTDAATLIAASSDLASADEMVDFPNNIPQKRFIELVRFGRLNITRALYLAKAGKLVDSVLAPADASSQSQEKFKLGTLITNPALLVAKPGECEKMIMLMPPKIHENEESDRWLAPAVFGSSPLCLVPKYIVRISASRSQGGGLKMTNAGPLLDVVYLLNPSNQYSNGGYGNSYAANAPMTVVMRELSVPLQGPNPVCDLTGPAPKKACFAFKAKSDSKEMAIDFEKMIYFGRISRAER